MNDYLGDGCDEVYDTLANVEKWLLGLMETRVGYIAKLILSRAASRKRGSKVFDKMVVPRQGGRVRGSDVGVSVVGQPVGGSMAAALRGARANFTRGGAVVNGTAVNGTGLHSDYGGDGKNG